MLDEINKGHALTLHEALQRSLESLQRSHIIDSNHQIIESDSTHTGPKFSVDTKPSTKPDLTTEPTKSMGFSCLKQLYEKNQITALDAIEFANNLKKKRESSLKEFHEMMDSLDEPSECIDHVVIIPSSKDYKDAARKKVRTTSSSSYAQLTQLQFKQQYLYPNKPCVIHELNQRDFEAVSSNWVKKEDSNEAVTQSRINTDWFMSKIGPTTLVPVRKMPQQPQQQTDLKQQAQAYESDATVDLDEDGRAVECETVKMTMKDWIHSLANQNAGNIDVSSKPEQNSLYLKDWHLQKILEDKATNQSNQSNSTTANATKETTNELYTVPKIFAGDLLNPFLLANGGGDYRFVYWGPKGSSTSIHFDVLNSFSWSFNVVGEKEWKFYTPHLRNDQMDRINESPQKKDGNEINPVRQHKTFEIIQKTGETIYVPSRWIHSVKNLRETLSINHNWITPSTLDEMHKCILSEIRAIDKELHDWGMSMDDADEEEENHELMDIGNLTTFRIREDMLRGCVGMDTTTFCVMVVECLSECLEGLYKVAQEAIEEKSKSQDTLWELWFDFTCTINVLYCILDEKQQQQSYVQKRICAMLGKRTGILFTELMKNLVDKGNSLLSGFLAK